MRNKLLSGVLILASAHLWAFAQHSAQGILLEVNPAEHRIVVSCDAIPGYMEAMTMPFTVHGSEDLKTFAPGATVRFNMVATKKEAYAEHLQVVHVTNFESEPMEAGRLTLLHKTLDPAAAAKAVAVGNPVPDFALTDQTQQITHLAQFKGKVVALTFTYSRCPNPSYCFRLSNNLSQLERRFHAQAGRNLILITIVIDPDQDRGKALERYAGTWKADPATWHFLTGTIKDVQNVAELFGMNFWSGEGFLTHSFHTVVIDRDGKLAANLEGNQFSAGQLGDMVEMVLNRPQPAASTAGMPQ
ncbi:SCO family protein [Terracidiphilus gabretensis]|uniref:SCO family protein n=1 Tax=Terracidiphilus gabretensis TaxID=1577687 RepID=UPI00071BF38C|nr:SCO family protein [Terracidiphilus gabretensis]